MPKNILLVRWKGGFAEKEDPASEAVYGRREAFLSVANIDSEASIESVGAQALSAYSLPRTGISASYEPLSDAETPYVGLFPGDSLTAPDAAGTPTTYRVEGFTATEDDDGNLTFTPELSTLLETDRRRQQRWLSRVGSGTLAGRSATATLLPTIDPDTGGGRVETKDVSFSKGTLEATTSPPLLVAKSWRLTQVLATVTAGTTSPCVSFQVLKNGVAQAFAKPGGTSNTTFDLTPSAARIVLLPSSEDILVTEADTISIALSGVAADASAFSVTATLAALT